MARIFGLPFCRFSLMQCCFQSESKARDVFSWFDEEGKMDSKFLPNALYAMGTFCVTLCKTQACSSHCESLQIKTLHWLTVKRRLRSSTRILWPSSNISASSKTIRTKFPTTENISGMLFWCFVRMARWDSLLANLLSSNVQQPTELERFRVSAIPDWPRGKTWCECCR